MNRYKKYSFFKIALRFALVFLFFVSFIEIIFSIIKNGSLTIMVNQYFANGNWKYFVKRLTLMSAFYGVFMAGYYKFIKK